jgi:hypothetical protein
MSASITFHPLGNADCTLIDLANGQKILIDYADMKNHDDPNDKRIDLPVELRRDLEVEDQDSYAVVCFSHLDDDQCCGADEFFWLEHAKKYQDEDRIKIEELWVPAAAILEDGLSDSARVIRQEARHRLKTGKGIRVFSRPSTLKAWLEKEGLTLESRQHLITDAGNTVPGFSKTGTEKVEFFIHCPFGWRQDENDGVVDRNQDSVVFQATFVEDERETHALFMSDIDSDTIDQIVTTTKRHKNEARLRWDIFKIPHHCSYTAVNWEDKGQDDTKPTKNVKWLCETQGNERGIMVSTSKPMPVKGSLEDDDVQPPHRQAGNYYKKAADIVDSDFKVTMEEPKKSAPKPIVVEISKRGASLIAAAVVGGAASVVSTQARAG